MGRARCHPERVIGCPWDRSILKRMATGPRALVDRGKRWYEGGKDLTYRILDTVPPVRRSVDELARIEVVDRSMAIGAQALLALIPVMIVLVAFLPDAVTQAAVDHFQSVTGLGSQGGAAIEHAVESATASTSPESVRTTTGFLGLVITLLSATSFGRAVQRLYERVWEQPHVGGVPGLRRSTGWLFGWLLGLQGIALVDAVGDHVDGPVLGGFFWVVHAALTGAVWWWSMRMLLAWRVPWSRLLFPAALTGLVLVMYSSGSAVVMPAYVRGSAAQFGTLGVVLAVATWLVGFAGIMVVCATLGRVFTEDPLVRALVTELPRRVRLPGLRAQDEGRDHGDEAVAEQPRAHDDDQQVQ